MSYQRKICIINLHIYLSERKQNMLELKNVSFSVGSADDELEIIDDISITFDDGKFVVITGPSRPRDR